MNLKDITNYTYAQLLQRVDQQKVWAHMLGNFKIGAKTVLNVLRGDKHTGSCCIVRMGQDLILMDFADSDYNGLSCISYYRKLHPDKPWYQVTQDILSISSIASPTLSKVKTKPKEIMCPIVRNWEPRDRVYWSKRKVSKKTLENRVFPISGYKTDSLEYITSELAYAYKYENKYKLYFPERKEYRFLGNLSVDDLWHTHKGNTLLVTKSHKDFLILETFSQNSVTHVQSENSLPSVSKIYEWEVTYDKILIWFDPDPAGIKNAYKLKTLIQFKEAQVINPDLKDCKDPDEYICKYGKEALLEILKNL